MAFPQDLLSPFLPSIPTEGNLFMGFILPFLLIFGVLFGVLSLVRVFGKRINVILSLVITLLVTATPLFAWFASILPTYAAIVALALFGLLFFFGTIRWALYRGRDIYEETGGHEHKLQRLAKERDKLWKKYIDARNANRLNEANAYYQKIQKIDEELQYESHK